MFLEILDKKRKDIFAKLYKILGNDYYLAGGTALALQIGHRESLDFDVFRYFSSEIKKLRLRPGNYSV
jgi:hypothetical protein